MGPPALVPLIGHDAQHRRRKQLAAHARGRTNPASHSSPDPVGSARSDCCHDRLTPKGVNTHDVGAASLDCEPRVSCDPPAKAPPFPVARQRKARDTIYKSFGNVLISTQPPEAHVVATGELDIASTSTLTALLSQAVAAGCRDVHIDMNGVTFCDASTIGLLVGLDRRLRTVGGSLTIGRCSPSALRLLHILGLDSLLNDYEDSRGRDTGVSTPTRQFA